MLNYLRFKTPLFSQSGTEVSVQSRLGFWGDFHGSVVVRHVQRGISSCLEVYGCLHTLCGAVFVR